MQALLNSLSGPIASSLIIAGVIVLVIVVLLARRLRRRQSPLDDSLGSSPGLSGPVDYTSLPLDAEPSGWRERFANLSIAGKILVVLVPILAILGILVLVLTLLPNGDSAAQGPLATAAPVPVKLTLTKADVIRVQPAVTISVAAEASGLADGAEVTMELLADGQPVAFLRDEELKGTVRRGRVEIQARRAEGAAPPKQGTVYSVRLSAADGSTVSDPLPLTVPSIYTGAFFGTSAAAPSATPAPPSATPAPTSAPNTTPTLTATPAASLPTGPAASVKNGGNVRRLPAIVANNVVGGVNVPEQVQLIARTPNGEWYRVRTIRDEVGWVSASLIEADPTVIAQVPIATVVTVFANGAVYEKPDSASTELDRVNKNEVVELKQKTAAGDWYEVENVRGLSGWVPANLLGIPADVAAKVPTAP